MTIQRVMDDYEEVVHTCNRWDMDYSNQCMSGEMRWRADFEVDEELWLSDGYYCDREAAKKIKERRAKDRLACTLEQP